MLRLPLLVFWMLWHPPPENGGLTDGRGWTYEFSKADIVWLARAVECEAGDYIPGPEAEAVVWTMMQRFYQTRWHHWASLGTFLNAYSQCIGYSWSSAGKRRTDRDIVASVDRMRAMRWSDIPLRSRWIVERFLRGDVANRYPGWVHFLACGYERHRAAQTKGPYYVSHSRNRCNAYYTMRETEDWTEDTVRVLRPAPSRNLARQMGRAAWDAKRNAIRERWGIATVEQTEEPRPGPATTTR